MAACLEQLNMELQVATIQKEMLCFMRLLSRIQAWRPSWVFLGLLVLRLLNSVGLKSKKLECSQNAQVYRRLPRSLYQNLIMVVMPLHCKLSQSELQMVEMAGFLMAKRDGLVMLLLLIMLQFGPETGRIKTKFKVLWLKKDLLVLQPPKFKVNLA